MGECLVGPRVMQGCGEVNLPIQDHQERSVKAVMTSLNVEREM